MLLTAIFELNVYKFYLNAFTKLHCRCILTVLAGCTLQTISVYPRIFCGEFSIFSVYVCMRKSTGPHCSKSDGGFVIPSIYGYKRSLYGTGFVEIRKKLATKYPWMYGYFCSAGDEPQD